ncbi:hypothetical protein G7Y89_g8308 [Cudoniella acicularis]|uniref:Uncharacterized protein n=1 Tax=Cudoniella acicularis TaxID=354080 RepID=A0A8H4RJD6_9HELO|nr:hypothetical protein G7Y89_g8308 [Cudoniella acicularis]
MLLTRSLPPQFLLPAWSAPRLTLALQQQQKRALNTGDSSGTKTKPANNTVARESASSALSLFEELFPEEKVTKRKDVSQEKKLDKLPRFRWKTEEEKARGARAREQKAILPPPGRRGERRGPMDMGGGTLSRSISLTNQQEDIDQVARRQASVLVLSCAMKSLEESDFFRIGPKGEHIEGWTSGIIKVIPGRDNNTLQHLDHYYILFSNRAAAAAYLDNIIRLHQLAKASISANLRIAGLHLPPSFLKNGEDVRKILRGFSLAPAYTRLHCRLVDQPYRPAVLRLLTDGGPAALVRNKSKSKAEDMVLLYSDRGQISRELLQKRIKDDGKSRNLHWKLAGGEDDIMELHSKEEPDVESTDGMVGTGDKKMRSPYPTRWVISFKDRHEARRFVMSHPQ